MQRGLHKRFSSLINSIIVYGLVGACIVTTLLIATIVTMICVILIVVEIFWNNLVVPLCSRCKPLRAEHTDKITLRLRDEIVRQLLLLHDLVRNHLSS